MVIETDVPRMINPRLGMNLIKTSNYRCRKLTLELCPADQGIANTLDIEFKVIELQLFNFERLYS